MPDRDQSQVPGRGVARRPSSLAAEAVASSSWPRPRGVRRSRYAPIPDLSRLPVGAVQASLPLVLGSGARRRVLSAPMLEVGPLALELAQLSVRRDRVYADLSTKTRDCSAWTLDECEAAPDSVARMARFDVRSG